MQSFKINDPLLQQQQIKVDFINILARCVIDFFFFNIYLGGGGLTRFVFLHAPIKIKWYTASIKGISNLKKNGINSSTPIHYISTLSVRYFKFVLYLLMFKCHRSSSPINHIILDRNALLNCNLY